MSTTPHHTVLKPCRLAELAACYGISINTMRRWLDAIATQVGPRKGRYYTIRQVSIIFRHFGVPGVYNIDESGNIVPGTPSR